MAGIAGLFARVKINNVLYSVQEWSIEDDSEALDVTNSEGKTGGSNGVVFAAIPGSFQSRTGGPAVAKIMLKNASFDPNEVPFDVPYGLVSDVYVQIEIFPNGLNSPSHQFPSVFITKVKHEGNVKTLQPVTVEGESDGSYLIYS